ncbi:unnamed protein product [Miscanthus lutarioriparius]|uniref:Amine oxidase domain-containing protein n=1 Tax=Miscanthus lutarioriparius TaxID=422564 RepID=A0A811MFP7_9POAL|nr:unnamed protein product [Miscanthus lutarioriparius]
MSGISAGKRLWDAGITDLVILEATDRIGGRIHKTKFAGLNVEMGANWTWKIVSVYQFDMALYTKIFLKFPKKFWPEGPDTEFFLYASGRRGYYPVWQESDNATKAEAVEVLRKMFPGKDVPDATDILVPRWWSNRFFKGTFSNWPIGVNRYEYDLLRAPVGRVYFTGEHTSEHYGYVHGAYLTGIDSADILINCAKRKLCIYHVSGKFQLFTLRQFNLQRLTSEGFA